MDLAAFSKDDFDAKEWINKTFLCPEAEKSKEEYATTIVAKLQSFIQEVNISLERTAEQVNQNLPRILREIEVMQSEAWLLQQQMGSVKGEVMKVEQDSSESMQMLLKMDHMKCCMQEASRALREADNWTTLSADVEEVFESGDINAIASKLVGMQNSLEILADVPDYDKRCARLESLKDRLEAMISPCLIATLNSQPTVSDVGLTYMKIFKNIKRLNTLQKYYHNYQKNYLLEQWKKIVEADPDESLVDWLNNFHDLLLSTWHSQMNNCQQLLPDIPAVHVLCDLLVDVLTNLDPSLSHCVIAGSKLATDTLQYLIELKQITDRFSKSLEISVQGVEQKCLQDVHVLLLVKTIYDPYRLQIKEYSSFEEQHLITQLKEINLFEKSDDLNDCVRSLGDSVSKVFCIIQEAESRCQQLTHGCGYISLINAVEGLLQEYSGYFRRILRLFESTINNKEEDISDDWSIFHQSLQATQVIGEIFIQVENLEAHYISQIREVGRKLGYYSSAEEVCINPFQAYDDVLLSPPAKKDFQKMISILQEETKSSPMKNSLQCLKKLCSNSGKLVSKLVLKQAEVHLMKVPKLKLWSEDARDSVVAGLPEFSLSPQEYITEVGQYLMTVPQHIEPFVLRDSTALRVALAQCRDSSEENDSSSNVADYLLECLARKITDCYCDNILKIPYITSHATSQLVTDISYVCDVLDDLGLSPAVSLQHLLHLLRAKPENFEVEAKSRPRPLIQKIRVMRRLKPPLS